MHPVTNPFANKPTRAKAFQSLWFWLFRASTYLILICATIIFATIFWKGGGVVFKSTAPFINIPFLTEAPETLHVFRFEGKEYSIGNQEYQQWLKDHSGKEPENHMTYAHSAGGIFPCIVGTVILVLGSMTIALLLGTFSAIYLSEYAKQGKLIRLIRLSILNLAGVPSIVFGLFGYSMFVHFLGWNVSILAGWFTLAFMVLPVIITASEEALRAVPHGYREGSLALGATQWQTIRSNVLPYALPGILTSSVLGVARVAGETAPIMFTAAYIVRDEMPWNKGFTEFFFEGVMALPYHIYVVSSKIPQNAYTEKVQYGTAFVFLVVVFVITLASILLRVRMRSKYRW